MRASNYLSRRSGAAARALIALCLLGQAGSRIEAADLKEARVTRTVNVVNLLPKDRSPVPARKGNVINSRTGLQTGMRSRAELEFSDKSVVRLGSNSIFSFKDGERELELQQGSVLLQIPKGRGTTKIKSLPITAAITGTTILFESSQRVLDAGGNEIKPGIVKLIVVEGSLEWAFNADPRKKLKMKAGEMVAFPSNARRFPQKVKVDLARIKDTSLLMNGGMGNLPDMSRVDREISTQNKQTRDANNPARGFPIKKPKPDNTDNRVREVEVANRVGPIVRMIRAIVAPPDTDTGPVTQPPAIVVIPTRPERCPQDSLDHLCRMPGFGAGSSN